MTDTPQGLRFSFDDAWLLDGTRTPFVDYTGVLSAISPIDLGIKVARAVLHKTGFDPADIGTTIAGSMAQASFDAYMAPRHIGLYAGVPVERPAHLVQRICGTGIEVVLQAAELVERRRVEAALCVGTESMSRNPVAAYTHRSGFRMGQVEFKDFLWEALLDPACSCTMGDTAENLARDYNITREEVDRYAERSFACARELGLDEDKLNVNGGAIAIGHPLGATGIRITTTVARELRRAGLRYGIAAACIGGGQGIAVLVENPDAG
jgi:acetyl-CoA C-acetyltransferase